MKYALKRILEPLKVVLQEVSCQEYASATIKIIDHIQIKEHRIHEVHEDQIELPSELQ
jgi:hypothetical protein